MRLFWRKKNRRETAPLSWSSQHRFPSLTHSQRTPSPMVGRLEGMGSREGGPGGVDIGTAQVWGLRLRSSPGWLAPRLLGILEGDREWWAPW